FNTNSQADSGSAGGRKASDSSKNEQHGDGGRALEKARKANEKLQEKLNNPRLSSREKQKIEQTMKNNIKKAQKDKKGENHSQSSKR
ncbi:MAG: hypothetical protein IJ566_03960, partial [Cardiobacteriaceae bacterium]|nr:hypothetical protein [Cardiobacteriaceae bacterium]